MESLDELEKRFYEELGVVPDVPAEILVNVKRRARASGVKRRIAVAACLLLALIIPTLLITQQMSASVAYADNGEAMDELLYAFEFMSGGFDTDFLFDGLDTVDYAYNGGKQASPAPELLSEDKLTKAVAKKETSNEN